MGYQVTVTELVGWEHSMKNELILAHYTGHRKRAAGQRVVLLHVHSDIHGTVHDSTTL